MTSFLQINLNRCMAAQALALQHCTEDGINIMLASEPYPVRVPSWHYDTLGNAAIANISGLSVDVVSSSDAGFVWIQRGSLRIYSCYWSPRPDPNLMQYRAFLVNLEQSIRTHIGESLVCGDFNAHHLDWGSRSNNNRGDALMDFIQAFGLIV